MATKMLWETRLPLDLATARENLGTDNLWKYLRYYRMYLERFKWKIGDTDVTNRIESLLFWRGQLALVKDPAYGLVIGEIDDKSIMTDPNGVVKTISVTGEGNYRKKNLVVGEDAIILRADETGVPPVLYIWQIANEILAREDIIRQQDNMLRKPILVTGEGEELDNAMLKAINILSGVQWININPKNKNKTSIALDKPAEVLNLQVGNAYKGSELWDSRKHFEELICDYLGYGTVKNEKRERMNTSEVNKDNSVGMTFYNSARKLREDCKKEVSSKLGLEINLEVMLEQEKEVEQSDRKTQMERTPNSK